MSLKSYSLFTVLSNLNNLKLTCLLGMTKLKNAKIVTTMRITESDPLSIWAIIEDAENNKIHTSKSKFIPSFN